MRMDVYRYAAVYVRVYKCMCLHVHASTYLFSQTTRKVHVFDIMIWYWIPSLTKSDLHMFTEIYLILHISNMFYYIYMYVYDLLEMKN